MKKLISILIILIISSINNLAFAGDDGKIQLNKKTSINSLLNKLKIPIKMVAIELNKKILDKSKISKIYIKENNNNVPMTNI